MSLPIFDTLGGWGGWRLRLSSRGHRVALNPDNTIPVELVAEVPVGCQLALSVTYEWTRPDGHVVRGEYAALSDPLAHVPGAVVWTVPPGAPVVPLLVEVVGVLVGAPRPGVTVDERRAIVAADSVAMNAHVQKAAQAGRQNMASGAAPPAPLPNLLDVALCYRAGPDCGRWQGSLDGVALGNVVDMFASPLVGQQYLRARLGSAMLGPGVHRLRLTSAGRNPSAVGFGIYLDQVLASLGTNCATYAAAGIAAGASALTQATKDPGAASGSVVEFVQAPGPGCWLELAFRLPAELLDPRWIETHEQSFPPLPELDRPNPLPYVDPTRR